MCDDSPRADYRPINALPYWSVIGEFVDSAVTDTALVSGRAPHALYPAAVAFVMWSWQSRGTPLERARIFRRTTAEEFIHRGMTAYMVGSRATHRATLWLMIDALNPGETRQDRRPLPRSAPTRPYTQPEIAALHSWAVSQGTARRRQGAVALLALGFGAGLATRELLGVQFQDIDLRGDDLSVVVREGRCRVVPVLPEWQVPLRRILGGQHSTEWLFRPGRAGTNPGQITDFLQRARTELDVRPSRMRTTWLVNHLAAGTAPTVLLHISGLQNLAALDKVTAYTPSSGGNK